VGRQHTDRQRDGVRDQPGSSDLGRRPVRRVHVERARNLIAGRLIYETHVYVYDRLTGTTEIVSERPDGPSTNGAAAQPSLSADGRYVAFVSFSEGLVPGDGNLGPDVSCAIASPARRRPHRCGRRALCPST
jgi:hypothetical protein